MAAFAVDTLPEDQPKTAATDEPFNDGLKEIARKYAELFPQGNKPQTSANVPAAPANPPASAPVAPQQPKPQEPDPIPGGKPGASSQPPAAPTPPANPEEEADLAEPPASRPITRELFKRLEQAKNAHKEKAKKYEADLKATAEKAALLEAELNKTKAALPPNLEEVQKALADAKRIAEEKKAIEEQLETISLERSPRFQNWWKSETGKHLKVAQSHVPADKRDEIAKLFMQEPSEARDTAIASIIDNLPSTGQRLVNSALEGIEKLRIERDEAMQQGSARFKELQRHEQQEKERTQQERKQRLDAITQKALTVAKNYSAFQPTGDAEHDAEIPKREAFVRAVLAGKVDENVAISMPAVALEYLDLTEKEIPRLKGELAKQAELIKQLQGSSPRPGDGGGGGKPPPQENKSGTTFAERVLAEYKGRT